MPLRVIHLVNQLGYGGVDHWLMNLLRLRNEQVKIDVVTTNPGKYDAEAESLGSNVFRVRKSYPFGWNEADIKKILLAQKYDAIHVPTAEFACYTMKIGAQCGVPVRIAHSHNTGRNNPFTLKNLGRIAYHNTINLYHCRKYATHLLACSEGAGNFYFGRNLWRERHPKKMVYCGIPMDHFDIQRTKEKRQDLCRKFNMPNDAIVIGHAGRLSYQKNQGFMLELFQKLAQRNPRYYLLVAGEGDLRKPLEKQVVRLGLQDRVRMPGALPNMLELMTQLFDTFLLPSHFEGLPVVMLEAIAAGLHCVCSDVITTDLTVPLSDRIITVSLNAPFSTWCDAIEESLSRRASPQAGVARMKQTPFSIEQSMETLLDIYRRST